MRKIYNNISIKIYLPFESTDDVLFEYECDVEFVFVVLTATVEYFSQSALIFFCFKFFGFS